MCESHIVCNDNHCCRVVCSFRYTLRSKKQFFLVLGTVFSEVRDEAEEKVEHKLIITKLRKEIFLTSSTSIYEINAWVNIRIRK